jgi:prepilin-type N-terminal cleavage/methylation domain-containing protein/prepilin-type processing-associated H-X9-DG protein
MTRKPTHGFTLIELLVVISIIALLLSIILPSLRLAKEAGKRIVCLSNEKQLALAWTLYAGDNDEKLCSPLPGWFGNDHQKYSWVAWKAGSANQIENWPGQPPLWSDDLWHQSITLGAIWSYVETKGVYRCPAGEKHEQITYASFGALGGEPRTEYGEILKKMSQLVQPGTRSVYIDEGKLTPHDFSVYYAQEKWWDQPPVRHNEGVTIAFADGHADHWKWKDNRTKEMSRMSWGNYAKNWQNKPCPDNEDLTRIRRAAWGRLGK